ncbi:MAG: thiamine pyrophosphate-dependent enzyme [Pseudomonadota bacterium]
MTAPQHLSTYLNERIGPLPFCPGCGHSTLIYALDEALVKLGRDPAKVVIVTDIGCIGLSDRHFVTSAFHGLHGRSITYACGLKLARPELTVIAIKGDGACGIGGAHLLNVARRNIGITLIVGNNFNYGMTGGQHSVTTPLGGNTTTTPLGNVEGPIDLCATAAAAGAAWVYRATMFDKQLPEILLQAIQQPGFAMVDIWELCAAYYAPRNKMRKTEVMGLLDQLGYAVGLVADKPRPEYTARYREVYQGEKAVARRKPPIVPRFESGVGRQIGILVAGSAGQKIKSTASVFAQGAILSGLNATQKDDYPITVMTGHSLAEIILSPERIDYTEIDRPDYLLIVSEDGLKKVRARVTSLPETSTIYVDEALELPETKARVYRFPFSKLGKDIGKLSVVSLALATLLEDAGIYPPEAFASASEMFQSQNAAQANRKAITEGVTLATSAKKTS